MKAFEKEFENGKITFVPYEEPNPIFPFYSPTAQIQVYNNDSEDEEYIDLYEEDIDELIKGLQELKESFPNKE